MFFFLNLTNGGWVLEAVLKCHLFDRADLTKYKKAGSWRCSPPSRCLKTMKINPSKCQVCGASSVLHSVNVGYISLVCLVCSAAAVASRADCCRPCSPLLLQEEGECKQEKLPWAQSPALRRGSFNRKGTLA